MAVKKRGLGRGLDALLGAPAAGNTGENAESDALRELALDALAPGKHQPRRDFDQASLDALSESIKAQGVVQPIICRPGADGKFEIVAGERRWRAARQAGLKKVPVVVRAMDERSAMAVALVENIQRSDLNPLEEAQAVKRLIDECQLTHEQCAQALGKSRVGITNLLRLMELEAEVQDLVRESRLSFGHAKVLLGADGERQCQLAKLVVQKGLTVRQTEALVHGEPAPTPNKPASNPHQQLESSLSENFGLPVKLQANDKGRGKLTVSFRNAAEMERLLKALQ